MRVFTKPGAQFRLDASRARRQLAQMLFATLHELNYVYATVLVFCIVLVLYPIVAAIVPAMNRLRNDQDLVAGMPAPVNLLSRAADGLVALPLEDGQVTRQLAGGRTGLYLGLELYRLRPNGQAIEGALHLMQRGEIVDVTPGGSTRKVVDCGRTDPTNRTLELSTCSVTPEYESGPVTLTFDTYPSQSLQSRFHYETTLTLKDIFASAPQRQPVTNKFVHEIIKDIPNGIPTIGNPDLYPLDYYDIGFKWSLIAPTSWRSVDYNTDNVAPLAFYGFGRGDDSGPGLAAQVIGTSGQNRAVLHLHGRNGVERAFILVIGAIPFVFAFVFLHLLFINRRTRGGSLNDFIVALAAAVLAILPLHAVLVPSGLDGLTLLDLWLGLGAGVLVCVTLGKYFTDVMADIRPKRPRASLKQGDARAPGHRPEAGGVSVAAAPAVDPGG